MTGRGWTAIISGMWLAALALLALTPSASAGAFATGDAVAACFSRDATTPRAAFAHPERFDCRTAQADLPAGDYWALSAPLPPRDGMIPVAVRFGSLWQRDATLYALYADGHVARMRLDGHTLTQRMQIGSVIEQPLPYRRIAPVRLLWHIEGAVNVRGILLGAQVVTHAQSADSNLLLGSLYAAFGGLCIALLVYNLALWVALRHRFQLAYCAMVAALLVYAFSESGALAWVWPDIENNLRIRVNYLSLAVAGATGLLFARSFFEPRVFIGWLNAATLAVAGALIGTAGLVVILAPWRMAMFDVLYACAFLLEFAIVSVILWRAWIARSNYLWAFALAWAAPIGLACARVACALHVVPWSFWLDNSTLVAMAIEALLSSVGIAYRMRVIASERDAARGAEIAARLLADTDPLTGLLNRRAFLHAAIGRADEQVLMLADIDHFKRINETIGHDGGDEALRAVAQALASTAPPDALVARMGGEEFAVLLPAAASFDPRDLLDAVRAARMPYDLSVTISVGSSTGILAAETDWKTMYRDADRALFAAKSAGRDRARRAPIAEGLSIAA